MIDPDNHDTSRTVVGQPRHDVPKRVTVRDAIEGVDVPVDVERPSSQGRAAALLDSMTSRVRQARIRRILRRAFKNGRSRIERADPDRYAVSALVRSDGVLEIWLMSRNWRTITITSRFRRVHMVHDDQGHLVAAVPARELAETVAVMAVANP